MSGDKVQRVLTGGSPKPKTQKPGSDVPWSGPSGLFPLDGKVGQLNFDFEWAFGVTVPCAPHLPTLAPGIGMTERPERVQRRGQLMHMALEAPVAPQSRQQL